MITSKRIKNYLRTKDTNTFVDNDNRFKSIPELTETMTKHVIKWNQQKISNEDAHKIKLRVRRVLVGYSLVKMIIPSRYKYKLVLPIMKRLFTSHRGTNKIMTQDIYHVLITPQKMYHAEYFQKAMEK